MQLDLVCRHAGAPSVTNLRMSAQHAPSRRAVVGSAAAFLAGNLWQAVEPAAAVARLPSDDDVLVYVGAGCFWHVQHEMVVAEQKLLGRNGDSFTAIAGYAGGTKVGKDGKVCYHNMAFDSDYGKLGHTEVVAVRVPEDSVEGFVEAYISLFDSKGIRADPQDAGGEYRCKQLLAIHLFAVTLLPNTPPESQAGTVLTGRVYASRACVRACVLRRSAIGLPGGIKNEAVSVLQDAAAKKGMKVLAGKGDEDDTLRARSIYVYDTEEFPFYAGELYHQYHNDMVSAALVSVLP